MAGSPSPTDLSVRHRPVRERGRVRFDQILTAARELLLVGGVEGFVIEDVAEAAGIPVGSVYQYFPNKFAIVAELDAIDTAGLVDDLESNAVRFPAADWQTQTDHLIDLLSARWTADPSRSAVWLAMRSNAATRSLAAAHSRQLVECLIPYLGEFTAGLSAQRRVTVAEVMVEMGQSLLHFSVHDGRPHPETVVELKRLLRAYLRAVALDSLAAPART